MATYATSSAFAVLDGTCEIDSNGDCTSYTSNSLGPATVLNLGNGCFEVRFPGPNETYVICARPNGTGFSGTAKEKGNGDGEEAWAATAIAQPAVSGRS